MLSCAYFKIFNFKLLDPKILSDLQNFLNIYKYQQEGKFKFPYAHLGVPNSCSQFVLYRLIGTIRPDPDPEPERQGMTSTWMLSLVKVLG